MNKIYITLLRHGQTSGNKEKRYIGCRTDEPLSEEGMDMLRALKYMIEKRPAFKEPELIFISPMKRARQTADILFPGYNKLVIDELTETDFGKFEGKNYHELSGDADYQAWIDSNGTAPFPGGESPEDFRRRSFEGFEKAIEIAVKKNCGRIWIVAHGGTVMSVMSRLTGKEYFDFMVNCAGGYEIKVNILGDEYKLVSYEKIP